MRFLITLIFTLLVFCSYSQSHISLHTGISHAWSPDHVMSPKGTGHSGYIIGADLRLLDDGICFLFTGQYGRFNLQPNNKYNFFSNHSLSYYKPKFGVGFDLFSLGEKTKFRSKIQGNLTYINKYDKSQIGTTPALVETGYIQLNESIAGLSSGLGFTYGRLDIDVEYEHGFYNIYFRRKESKLNFLNLTAGVRL